MSETGRNIRADASEAALPSNAASIPSVAAGSSAPPVANPTTVCNSATATSAPTARRAKRDPWPSRPATPAGARSRTPVARQIPANVRRWSSARRSAGSARVAQRSQSTSWCAATAPATSESKPRSGIADQSSPLAPGRPAQALSSGRRRPAPNRTQFPPRAGSGPVRRPFPATDAPAPGVAPCAPRRRWHGGR